jgi:hypothetical protein
MGTESAAPVAGQERIEGLPRAVLEPLTEFAGVSKDGLQALSVGANSARDGYDRSTTSTIPAWRRRGDYQLQWPLPFVPGSEVAGVVRRAPAGTDLQPTGCWGLRCPADLPRSPPRCRS